MGAFARITVNVAGREVPCYPTMGAMLLFEETTGKDVSKMDFTSVSDQFTYLYCCASEASAREKQELGMSLKEFAVKFFQKTSVNGWRRLRQPLRRSQKKRLRRDRAADGATSLRLRRGKDGDAPR